MKHSIKITLILLSMFFVTQLIGLGVVGFYSPHQVEVAVNNTESVNYTTYNLPYGMDPPQDTNPQINLVSFVFAIAIAVGIMLLLMKVGAEIFLRGWFFIVVTFAISITLNAALFGFGPAASIAAFLIALGLSFFKIFKRGIVVHNITELMIYPGIASIFVPLLNIPTVSILLILISIYDMYAVWHSGFMQKMAKYQMEKVRVFSGFFVPYLGKEQREMIAKAKKSKKKDNKKMKVNIALLGGGDVVFPIILAGVVLHTWGLIPALIISIGATIALGLLFYYSEKGKFYPAMPFISAGCFIALGIAYLIH